MSDTQYPGLKDTPSKWLLAVVFLLSFFSFSGLVVPTQTKLVKPQTTLVIHTDARFSKSIAYKRVLIKSPATEKQVLVFIELHSRQISVHLATLSNFCIQPKTDLFYRVKTASQNAGEDPGALLG